MTFRATLLAALALIGGCSINPAKLSPKVKYAGTASQCSRDEVRSVTSLTPLLSADQYEKPLSRSNAEALQLTQMTSYVHDVNADFDDAVTNAVPASLRNDKTVLVVKDLLAYQYFTSLKSAMDTTDVHYGSRAMRVLDREIVRQKPPKLSVGDIKAFFTKLKAAPAADSSSRLVSYEQDYFNGTFVGRMGETYAKPSVSLTISDQVISGALTVLVEAVADEMFSKPGHWTPVWADHVKSPPTTYYPGDSSDEPTYLAYELAHDKTDESSFFVKISSHGCGMTKLKSKALIYIAEKAGAWASGESGIVVGAFGGTNVGLPVFLGKISIGDNKVLQSIVQALLSAAAKRAAFEGAIPVLLSINQPKKPQVSQPPPKPKSLRIFQILKHITVE